MQFRKAVRPPPSINIAPLVDVVFLLVIFFAVSTTFLDTAGLELELPESTSSAAPEPEELAVMLAVDGTLSFRGEVLSPEDLTPRLEQALAERERKTVVLRADEGARHGDVVRVMDSIRDAGADSMTVAARAPAEP